MIAMVPQIMASPAPPEAAMMMMLVVESVVSDDDPAGAVALPPPAPAPEGEGIAAVEVAEGDDADDEGGMEMGDDDCWELGGGGGKNGADTAVGGKGLVTALVPDETA